MRMLDYKHYDIELHEHYVLDRGADALEAEQQPARAPVRAARRRRCRGSTEDDRHIWRYVFIYPNTTIDLYPDQVNTWQMLPGRGRADARRVRGYLSARQPSPRTRAVQWINRRLNTLVLNEDIDLVENVQHGLQDARLPRAARCRAARTRSRGSPTGSAPTSRR